MGARVIFGVQKRSHDREDPFGRKFLNSLLDTQASFFFFTGNMRPDLNDPCFPDH